MAQINPRHALTEDEERFCRIFAAFGFANRSEAYRRAYLVPIGDEWYRREEVVRVEDGSLRAAKGARPLSPKQVEKLSAALVAKQHIAAYLEELRKPTSDHARQVLADQVLFGDATAARRAAERILELEDKLGFRDAAMQWAHIMCEAGATVAVPLPTVCPECHTPLEVEFDLKDLFPDSEPRAAN